jgi:hypothetical protein
MNGNTMNQKEQVQDELKLNDRATLCQITPRRGEESFDEDEHTKWGYRRQLMYSDLID